MSKTANRSVRNSDVVFIGWQGTSWGEVLALYNITVAGHPSYGSTVTDRELRMLHMRIRNLCLLKDK
jgi:hypothetical protein